MPGVGSVKPPPPPRDPAPWPACFMREFSLPALSSRCPRCASGLSVAGLGPLGDFFWGLVYSSLWFLAILLNPPHALVSQPPPPHLIFSLIE